MKINEIRNKLARKGLKVTSQRLAVLEAIVILNNHPAAENIIDYIRKSRPNFATATVYKVLDALETKKIIKKVKTEKDIMRYDAVMETHNHLYCYESERIEDYNDEELRRMITQYFEKKEIPDFKIEDFQLQIIGKFLKGSK